MLAENEIIKSKLQDEINMNENPLDVNAWILSTLSPGLWICDDVINNYARLIYDRNYTEGGGVQVSYL